jgi:RNA polymerase sigma factor (sigma-70 family)
MHNEKELIDQCLKGVPKSQEALYKHYAPRMYGVCMRYARNTLEADDILQEGFIKVFNFLKDYRHEGSLEGWIRRIVVNTAINYYRSRLHEWEEVSLDKAGSSPKLETAEVDNLSRDELLALIQQLPEGYRLVFNLYVIEGYNHQEIGKLLNISENTSKSQLSRARAWLQEKITQRKLKS